MSAGAEKQSGVRLVAVCMFIGIPLLLAALTALNLVQFGDDTLAIAEKQGQIAALVRRLNTKPEAGKSRDLAAIYVSGTSRSLAGAALQQYMVEAVSASSSHLIEIASMDQETSDNEDEAHTIRLKTTLDTDNQGLLKLLYRLESGLPLLDVETLSVRRLAGSDDGKSEKLRVEIGVRGKWRQGKK